MAEWFKAQLNKRKESRESALRRATENLDDTVNLERADSLRQVLRARSNSDAIKLLASFYGFDAEELSCLEDSEIYYRPVDLEDDWYQHSCDPVACFDSMGRTIILLPESLGGYHYFDESGKRHKVDAKTPYQKGFCFFRELPPRPIGFKELVSYIFRFLLAEDFLLLFFCSLLITGLGLLLPNIVETVTAKLTLAGNSFFYGAMFMALCVILAQTLLSSISGLCSKRVIQRAAPAVSNATIIRIFSLSPQERVLSTASALRRATHSLWDFSDIIARSCFAFFSGTLFTLAYIIQLAVMAKVNCGLLILAIGLEVGLMVIYGRQLSLCCKRRNRANFDEQALLASCLSGIAKIKFVGAFPQCFCKWSTIKAEYLKAFRKETRYTAILEAIASISRYLLLLILFLSAAAKQSEYGAFTSAVLIISLISAQITGLVKELSSMLTLRSVWQEIEPLLLREVAAQKLPKAVGITGGIRIENLTFAYPDSARNIIQNFSLTIRPGEYIAVVGESACGKSTLLKLLLGILIPQSGSAFYGGNNIAKVDHKSLMREVGCIMQQDRMISGTLRDNLTLSQKPVTDEDIWQALRSVCMENEVREMPKGLDTFFTNTMATELSKGQEQRILIARAIVSKPKILIMDEATSALDNILQHQIKDSLDKMTCTRIVVAHRLSTVINCDRILVLKDGGIMESGTYAELMEKNGLFSRMVLRQQVK